MRPSCRYGFIVLRSMELLAQWLSALGSVGALIAATWAAVTAKGLYRVEQARDEAARVAAARADASRVHAWVAEEIPEGGSSGDDVLVIMNGAGTPIYDVCIESGSVSGSAQPPARLHMLPPGEFMMRRLKEGRFAWAFPESTKHALGRLRPISKHESRVVTALDFMDGRGRRWHRAERGELSGPHVGPPEGSDSGDSEGAVR